MLLVLVFVDRTSDILPEEALKCPDHADVVTQYAFKQKIVFP